MKVIHYPRVSSKKQANEGDSIEFQDKRLKQHSEENKDECVGIYTDAGKSASIPDDKMNISYSDGKLRIIIDVNKRDGMKRILDEVSSSLWDGIKITKWDRFSRNNVFSKIVQIFFDRNNKKLIAVDDSDDPLLKDIKGALSEEEIRKMKGRVRDVRLLRFSQGRMVGKAPFGYKSIIKDKKVIGFKLCPKQSKVVYDVFLMASNGASYKEICSKHKLKPQSYYNIIKNKVYMGIIKFEGKEKVGVHKPIINKELFEKCQKAE